MKMRIVRLLILTGLMTLVLGGVASAHEGREVGAYALNFGWQQEPAYAGLFNGPEIAISVIGAEEGEDHDEHGDNPLEGVEIALSAEVTFGPETITIPLRPTSDDPTHFVADLIPTLPGDYSFRIFGTIGEQAVDETFNSAEGEFSSVEPMTDIMFPAMGAESMDADAQIADLEARIAALEAALAELQGE
jgi:hypothetical protein